MAPNLESEHFRHISLEKALNSRVSTGGSRFVSHFGKTEEESLNAEQIDLVLRCLRHTPHVAPQPVTIECNGKRFDTKTFTPSGKRISSKPIKRLRISWVNGGRSAYASKSVNAYWLERGMGQEMIHVAGSVAQAGTCMIGGVHVDLAPMVPYLSTEAPQNYRGGNLPEPRRNGDDSAIECVEEWKPTDWFRREKITPAQLGQLLWAGWGCTPHFTYRHYYPYRFLSSPFARQGKTIPSRAAVYTLALHVLDEKGVFSYVNWDDHEKIATHSLKTITREDVVPKIQRYMSELPNSPTYVVVATVNRLPPNFSVMEAGYAALHISLQARALKLVSSVFAMSYEQMKTVRNLARLSDTPVALIPVGYPSR